MITLQTLVDERLISPGRTQFKTNPPRINAATPEARAALGYLSTNSGSCHNRESSIASLGLLLKHEVFLESIVMPRSRSSALESKIRSPAVATSRKTLVCFNMPSTSVVFP
jgi:hypothetical protein